MQSLSDHSWPFWVSNGLGLGPGGSMETTLKKNEKGKEEEVKGEK